MRKKNLKSREIETVRRWFVEEVTYKGEPYAMETEEVVCADQMRLFYVAMTRAKKRLYIMHDFSGEAEFVKHLGWGVERWND